MDSIIKKRGSGGIGEGKERETSAPCGEDVMVCERERSGSVCSEKSDVSVKRKRRSEMVERGCVDVDMDDTACLREIGVRLRKFLFVESNRVSKAASEFILNCVGDYEEMMMRLIGKNERLQGRLDESMRRVDLNVMDKRSYASVCGKDDKVRMSDERAVNAGINTRSETREHSYAVIVRANDAKMSSEQVKEKVMRNVSKELNVRVRAVRKTRNGGIAIETASENELKKVIECKRFNELGLNVERPRRIGPKLIIYDVPNELTNDEFMKELYDKNLKGCVSENEFKERVRVVSRNSKKGAVCGNMILEVSRRIVEELHKEGRLYINWRAFRFKDFVSVLRCHKCYAFGHMMRECGMKERLCQKCCEEGHLMRDCKKETVCRNCKMKGSKCDHSILSDVCPEYLRILEREKLRISHE